MYDPSLYKDYAKLKPLIEMVSEVLDNLNWRELHASLVTLEKDLADAPLTWYAAWCKNNEILFESNTALPHKLGDDNGDLEGAVNFHLELTNDSSEQFKAIKDYVFSMYGVTYAGFHFLNSNSIIPEHTDKDALSIVFMYETTNGVIRTGEESHTFEQGQLFAFDATVKHSAYNKSDKDWIMFAIRCTQDSFNL